MNTHMAANNLKGDWQSRVGQCGPSLSTWK